MDKAKTSSARKKSRSKSMKLNGVKIYPHDPTATFRDHKFVKQALAEALIDGDKEAFIEILSAYVRTHNVAEVCKRTKLSRTVVYEAIRDDGNPSLDTLCKIMTSFRKAS